MVSFAWSSFTIELAQKVARKYATTQLDASI